VEIEAKLPGFVVLNNFCFDYMPSSVELLDIEKITVPVNEIRESTNDLLAKLHEYHGLIMSLSSKLKIAEAKIPKEKKEN